MSGIREPGKFRCTECQTRLEVSVAGRAGLKVVFKPNEDILCIDFGTSSLRAALRPTATAGAKVLELGEAVGSSIDRASIPSAIFVDEDGERVYFGEEALAKGLRGEPSALYEISPKRWLTEDEVSALAGAAVRGLAGTRAHLLAGLIGYALSVVAKALDMPPGRLKAIEVRMPHPVWRASGAEALGRASAQVLDAGRVIAGQVGAEIGAAELAELCRQAEVERTLHGPKVDVVEPIAAALELFANTENTREVCVVVDVGAGTIDLGAFISLTPRARGYRRRLVSLAAPRSIYAAGDLIDEELVGVIEEAAPRGLRREAKADLRRRKRIIKETLFKQGTVFECGVSVALGQLLARPKIQEMKDELRREFMQLLREAAPQIRPYADMERHPVRRVDVVFAGGGANIEFLRESLGRRAELGDRQSLPIALGKEEWMGPPLPASYERLAVALGGTAPKEEWPVTGPGGGHEGRGGWALGPPRRMRPTL